VNRLSPTPARRIIGPMPRRVRPQPLRQWIRLVRQVASHPSNRDGADKTWVVVLRRKASGSLPRRKKT
jgi:hypothetical protein